MVHIHIIVPMALCKVTLTRVVVLLFFVYMGYNCYILYSIFHPPECKPSQGPRCILPAYAKEKPLEARPISVQKSFVQLPCILHIAIILQTTTSIVYMMYSARSNFIWTGNKLIVRHGYILVRQEVHTLSIGNGHTCAFRTGPGLLPGYTLTHRPTSCRTNNHFVNCINS